jgi:hypothetical protein
MKDEKTFNQKANFIREWLDLEVSQDDLSGLEGKLLKLTSLVGLAAELKARAQTDLRRRELFAFAKYKSQNLQPSILNTVIKGEAAEEYGKLELADRLCAGLAHSMDAIRTIISLRKEEMRNSNFQI